MRDVKNKIETIIKELKQERDTLQVKLHLAKLDAGDEWKKLEAKLAKLEAKAREMGSASAEASKDIGTAAKLLGQEIRKGFAKIAERF